MMFSGSMKRDQWHEMDKGNVNMYVFGFVHVLYKLYREEHPPEASSDL